MTPRPVELTRLLGLQPHPEGGAYREIWRAPASDGVRPASTLIYFLLDRGQVSRWHRVDADEIWQHLEGGPLDLLLWREGQEVERVRLGPVDAQGTRPQAVVPAGVWQAAWPVEEFVLSGCTVAPAFEFRGFRMLADEAPLAERLRGRHPGLADLL
jgi:hypothetical protein